MTEILTTTSQAQFENGSKCDSRKVLDPIHGFITFPMLIWKFIDTQQFQRLREIKQLGAASYVFPGANHSRFEHSLGTAHLCGVYMDYLMANHKQYYPLQIQKDAKNTVVLAGLLHDLGHGPFSHMFDNILIKQLWDQRRPKWTHQQASLVLIDLLIKQNGLQSQIQPEQLKRIKNMIKGKPDADDPRPWQYEIVSNQHTGIDVDKFDYFKRDSFYLGVTNTFVEYDLLMRETKILDHQTIEKKQKRLCYPVKYADKIYDIFFSRYRLYKNFYLNKICQGIQLMLCDVFTIANKCGYNFLKICENLNQSPQHYVTLTDTLVSEIERSEKAELQDARRIIKNIKKRDLYKFVIETNQFISAEMVDPKVNELFSKKTVADLSSQLILHSEGQLQPNDFVIVRGSINYGKGDKNPLDLVKFYKKNISQLKICQSKKEELSLLSTPRYCETYIRLFLKIKTEKKHRAAIKAFNNMCSNYKTKINDNTRTPYKSNREQNSNQSPQKVIEKRPLKQFEKSRK